MNPMHHTMTPQEAEAVVRLQMERGGDPSAIRTEDVAEALRVPPSEVERLLAEVRTSTTHQMRARRKKDVRLVWLAAAFAIFALPSLAYNFFHAIRPEKDFGITPPVYAGPAVESRDEFGFSDGEKNPPDGALPQVRVGTGSNSTVFQTEGQSTEAVANQIDGWIMQNRGPFPRDPEADLKTIQALKAGHTDDPALAKIPAWFFYGEDKTDDGAFLTVYEGQNPTAQKLARESRIKTLMKMLAYP